MEPLNASMNKPAASKQPVRRIGFLTYPLMEVLDLAGPYEVFSFASFNLLRQGTVDHPVYQLEVLAEKAGPVVTLSGLELIATRSFHDDCGDIDTLFIPGGFIDPIKLPHGEFDSVLENSAVLEQIVALAPKVRRLASVCSGAFLLAQCGLLDHRRATTHWDFCARLQQSYPAIKVEPDKIFIRDDNIYTSGGITAGIDLALSMLEEDWGREIALYIARYLVVFLKRSGGQSQFSTYLTSHSSNRPDIRELQAWIIENPAENHHVDELAERMAMSPRNFSRTFSQETGMTPAKFVEKARIDAARQYLEIDAMSIDDVARKAGFMDAERMRRAFIRHLGINPKIYRERFSLRTG